MIINNTDYSSGYWMWIKYVAPVNDVLTSVLSIIGNLVLILLVVLKTTSELKVYSRLLILNCVVDLVYTASVLITQTAIDFDHGTCLMMVGGPLRNEPQVITWMLINWYVTSLFSCVMFLPVPFIFRYFAVCKGKVLNALEFTFLILICIIIAIAYGCLHGYTFFPGYVKNMSSYDYIIDSDFWKDSDGKLPTFVVAEIQDGRLLILVSTCIILASFSYSLVIACNIAIYRKLGSLKMSKRSREIQAQLSKVLKYQATVPFLICVTPLSLVFILCGLGVRTAGKGYLLPIVLAWIPVFNSYAAMVLVREYRVVFTQSLCFRKTKAIILRRNLSDVMPNNISMSQSSKVFQKRTSPQPVNDLTMIA